MSIEQQSIPAGIRWRHVEYHYGCIRILMWRLSTGTGTVIQNCSDLSHRHTCAIRGLNSSIQAYGRYYM